MFFQSVFAFFTGAMVANLLGWSSTLGTFLGAIFSISSSMVAIPIIKQQNAMKQPFAQFTMGVAILEDIFAVVLLVILSNLRQGYFNFSDCFNLIFWITVFISSMLIFGRLAAQKFIKLLKKISNEEIVHICVVGLILLLSELSSHYSNALGAFLAGAIFSNTQIIHRLESMIAPIRDVFTAVFFVAIGMLIDPKLLWNNKGLILSLSVIVVLGQFISAWLGFFLSGQKPIVSLRAALPKSQIGEFSFVIAALAQTLGLDDGKLMAITVGTSLFSIIGVNLLCGREDRLIELCNKYIPNVLKTWGNLYQNVLISVKTHLSGSRFLTLIQKPLVKIVLHFFLINAIVWCSDWACHFLETHPLPHLQAYELWIQRGIALCALLLALPFMSCVVRNLNLIIMTICKHTLRKLFTRLNRHTTLYQIFQLFVATIATLIFTWIFLISAAKYLPNFIPILILFTIGSIFGFAFWRYLRQLNSQFEFTFLESFSTELESENEKRRQALIKMTSKRHPFNLQTCQITLTETSHLIGLQLQESELRAQTHTLLLGVSRNGFFMDKVFPDHIFYPGDTLFLLGTEQQLNSAKAFIEKSSPRTLSLVNDTEFDYDQVTITDNHPFLNETVASVDVRKKYGVNIVGIQRKGQYMDVINPQDILKIGDCVLFVGHRKNLDKMKQVMPA